MSEENENQDFVKCQNCSTVTAIVDGRCHNCSEKICTVCGCTDSHACQGGCYWTRPNVCSQCDADTAEDF